MLESLGVVSAIGGRGFVHLVQGGNLSPMGDLSEENSDAPPLSAPPALHFLPLHCRGGVPGLEKSLGASWGLAGCCAELLTAVLPLNPERHAL